MDKTRIARIHSIDDILTIGDTIDTLYFNKCVDFTPLRDFTWSDFPNIKKVIIHLDGKKNDFSSLILPETTSEIYFYLDSENIHFKSLIYPEKVKSIFIFVNHNCNNIIKELNRTKELDKFISGFPTSLEQLHLETSLEKGMRSGLCSTIDLYVDVLFFPTCIQKIYVGRNIKIDYDNLPPVVKYYCEPFCDLDEAKIICEKLQDGAEIYFDFDKCYRKEHGKEYYCDKVKIETLQSIFGKIIF